jgi:hypothetical protein
MSSALSGLFVSRAYKATARPSALCDVIVVVNNELPLEDSNVLILELL